MASIPTGRPRGQPTKYRPEMCAEVVELGKLGKTKHEMAKHLDITMSMVQNYEKAHPEFLVAIREAVDYAHAFWDEKLKEAALGDNPNANATLMIFTMKNRFKEHYGDMTRIEHSGIAPLQVNVKLTNSNDTETSND